MPHPVLVTRRMHIACWLIKATGTHSEYVTHIAFPLQQWVNAHQYYVGTYIACIVTF